MSQPKFAYHEIDSHHAPLRFLDAELLIRYYLPIERVLRLVNEQLQR